MATIRRSPFAHAVVGLAALVAGPAQAATSPTAEPCLFAFSEKRGGEPIVPYQFDGRDATVQPILDPQSFDREDPDGRPAAAVPITAWSEASGRYAVTPIPGESALRVYSVLPTCALKPLPSVELGRCPGGGTRRVDNLMVDASGGPPRLVVTSGTCPEIQVFRALSGELKQVDGSPFPTPSQQPVTAAVVADPKDRATPSVLLTSTAATRTLESYRLTSDGSLLLLDTEVAPGTAPPAGLDVSLTMLEERTTVVLGYTEVSADAQVTLFRLDLGDGELKELTSVPIVDGRRGGSELPTFPLIAPSSGPPVSIWATQPAAELLSCIVIEQLDVDPLFVDLLELPCPTAIEVSEILGRFFLHIRVFDVTGSIETYEVLGDGSLTFISSVPTNEVKSQGIVFLGP